MSEQNIPLLSNHDGQDASPPYLTDSSYLGRLDSSDSAINQNSPVISETIPVPGGEEPPPTFTPYEAEYFETSDGDIVSHDPHLNSDGEALYRFLLSHAQSPPSYSVRCKGTHDETRTRWVSYERDGKSESRIERYTETITDFDFCIDIGQHIVPAPVVSWSVADYDPVYRGGMVREVDGALTGRRVANAAETKVFEAWDRIRRRTGLPPWAMQSQQDDGNIHATTVLRSSKTLRQWADEYCDSPKLLKEFVYEKILYGWNFEELKRAIHDTISMTPYSGDISVSFDIYRSKIYVRPDNSFSRTLSKWWMKALLWVTLIYPFIWMFKRFHPLGGGRWKVCGGAYALKRWVEVRDKGKDDGDAGTSDGIRARALVGVKEGEWFRIWQPTISRAVMNGYRSHTPLYAPDPSVAGYHLDGY